MTLVDHIVACLHLSLLKPRYRRMANRHPLAGHCYVASEAAFYLLGGKEAGFKPMFIKHEGEPHWFLQDKWGVVWDLTAAQFKTPVPYHLAKGKGFLTKKPSNRAQLVANAALTRARLTDASTKLHYEP